MSILSVELTTGPRAAEIAPLLVAGNDAAIAAVLNRKDIPAYSLVTWAQFAEWAAATGVRADIEAWKTHAVRAIRAIAWTLSDGLIRGAGAIDFSKAGELAMIDALVTATLLSAADKTSLLTLATIKLSRADQLGITVTDVDIRKTIWADNGTRLI